MNNLTFNNITPLQLNSRLQITDILLLDVREPWEYKIAKIKNSVLIPLDSLLSNIEQLKQHQETVCICHHGVRSSYAATLLLNEGFTNVNNLAGGIDAWSLNIDNTVLRY